MIDTTNYVVNKKTSSNASYYQLLTTGSSEDTSKMNICDFAGNEIEWTLEKYENKSCVGRGGSCNYNGVDLPAFHHYYDGSDSKYNDIGFRPTLY